MAASQVSGRVICRERRSVRRGAFTLIELLVVIAIISILMGMLVGVAMFANQAILRARARAEVQELHNALQRLRVESGAYPLTKLSAARPYLPQSVLNRFNGRNSDTNLVWDPWKHPFVYKFDPQNAEAYILYSDGPDTNNTADNIYSGK